jgi:ech hydrogenase subunit F
MAWMFPTIIKNLFSRPATRRYPFKDIREPFPGYRGRIYWDVSKCDLCGDCARVCPAEAIEVSPGNSQITYDPFKCIYCGTCVQTCLPMAISQDKYYTKPAAAKGVETISVPV